MVELNQTLFPLLGPIGTVINSLKVLIGGAFGLYLIILYFRVKEYILVRKLLVSLQKDIHTLAEKQGIDIGPPRRVPGLISFLTEKIRTKIKKKQSAPAEKKTKK